MNHLFLLVSLLLFIWGCNPFQPSFEKVIDRIKEYKGQVSTWVKLDDKTKIGDYSRVGNNIFAGDIRCPIEPLKGIDATTFEVLTNTDYARDSSQVYYPISVVCYCGGYCSDCFYNEYVIPNARATSFVYLGDDYATDGQHAYFCGEPIPQADGAAFTYLGKNYAVDQHNAYFRGTIIPQANGATFRVIQGPTQLYFGADTQFVFHRNKSFEEADPLTFSWDSAYFHDTPKWEYQMLIKDKTQQWLYSPPATIQKIKKQ